MIGRSGWRRNTSGASVHQHRTAMYRMWRSIRSPHFGRSSTRYNPSRSNIIISHTPTLLLPKKCCIQDTRYQGELYLNLLYNPKLSKVIKNKFSQLRRFSIPCVNISSSLMLKSCSGGTSLIKVPQPVCLFIQQITSRMPWQCWWQDAQTNTQKIKCLWTPWGKSFDRLIRERTCIQKVGKNSVGSKKSQLNPVRYQGGYTGWFCFLDCN